MAVPVLPYTEAELQEPPDRLVDAIVDQLIEAHDDEHPAAYRARRSFTGGEVRDVLRALGATIQTGADR